jgi:hypothetical protein
VHPLLPRTLAYCLYHLLVLLVRPKGEVHSEHIHPRIDQLVDDPPR